MKWTLMAFLLFPDGQWRPLENMVFGPYETHADCDKQSLAAWSTAIGWASEQSESLRYFARKALNKELVFRCVSVPAKEQPPLDPEKSK